MSCYHVGVTKWMFVDAQNDDEAHQEAINILANTPFDKLKFGYAILRPHISEMKENGICPECCEALREDHYCPVCQEKMF